jgi:hypothetical protein
MHDPQPPPPRQSQPALIALAGIYAMAAGMHGVLAAATTMWWFGVLAGVLGAVAVAFAVRAWRRGGKHRESQMPPLAVRPEDPVVSTMRRRDTDPSHAYH